MFSTTVKGSEPYIVRLTLRAGAVRDHLCRRIRESYPARRALLDELSQVQ